MKQELLDFMSGGRLLFIILVMLLMVVGCRVGPDYCVPDTCMPGAFVEDKPCESAVMDEDLVHWWECTFRDEFLNGLMERALSCNFDLRIAIDKVCQARESYWVQFTSLFPEIDSDFQATRFRTSESFEANRVAARRGTGIASTQNFFQIGLDAIWEIDLFGKNQRAARSAFFAWEATAEDARGVKITVLSEVANTYVMICYFQRKVELAMRLVEFDEGLLAMARERFQAGLANEEEVMVALSTAETDRAALSVYETGLKSSIYSLAVLLGVYPETLLCDFQICRCIPRACGKIPATLPSELLRRRPDIASAERTLAAQTEQIGVAVAALFPTISLVGSSSSFAANPLQGANFGFSSDMLRKLISGPSRIWGIGALVTLPVFDFGKRCANIEVQKLLTDQAYLTYEKTVITALQEVETALTTYFNEERRYVHFMNQSCADERNLSLVADQFQAGLVDYTQVLNAKEKWLVSANLLADSEQALGTDLITIYKVLGGDW